MKTRPPRKRWCRRPAEGQRRRARKLIERPFDFDDDLPVIDLPPFPIGLRKIGETDDDRPPTFSDEAIALRFAATHADKLRFVAAWGKWLSWQGTHWQFD